MKFEGLEALRGHFRTAFSKMLFDELTAAVDEATYLTQIIKNLKYISTENLQARLLKIPGPEVDLGHVAMFLTGYLSAESHQSEFDTKVFGDHTDYQAKVFVVDSALVALLTLMDDFQMDVLDERLQKKTEQKRKRKK